MLSKSEGKIKTGEAAFISLEAARPGSNERSELIPLLTQIKISLALARFFV
jgi:hypothetical protein